jgi:50S ribosomal protein L16 3-hydroxylase
MTYSVGFRAPSRGDLVSAWADHVLDTLDEDDRYGDPDLSPAANPGEITPNALAHAREMVLGALGDPEAFAAWFGRHVTEPKDERIDWSPEEPISADDLGSLSRADGAVRFERNPASRFSFVREGPDAVILFVDGASFTCSGASASAAQRICADRHFALAADTLADTDVMRLVVDLADRGCIAPEDED